MLARPEAAIRMAPTLRTARQETLGSVRLPKGPLRDGRRPSTFDGDYLDRGIPGESDGRDVAHGDGPQAASAGLAKSPEDAVPVPSAATVPWAFSAATTSSGARVRLGVDLSEWPPFFPRLCDGARSLYGLP